MNIAKRLSNENDHESYIAGIGLSASQLVIYRYVYSTLKTDKLPPGCSISASCWALICHNAAVIAAQGAHIANSDNSVARLTATELREGLEAERQEIVQAIAAKQADLETLDEWRRRIRTHAAAYARTPPVSGV